MSEHRTSRLKLKVTEKKVPFREGEDKVMYCLKTDGAHPLNFGDKVIRQMMLNGCPKAWAQMAVTTMSEAMADLLSEGHAVNIEGLGTFRLTVNSKAHASPADCSLADVRRKKLQFYPDKEMQKFLDGCTFQISNQKKFVEKWKQECGKP